MVRGRISIRTRNITHLRRTGEFYGINPPSANLELLARFFERYPEYVDKAFLSVKVRISDSCAHTGLNQVMDAVRHVVQPVWRSVRCSSLLLPHV